MSESAILANPAGRVINKYVYINPDLIPEELGVYQYMIDHDREIRELPIEPKIINDMDLSTIEGKERLNNLLLTRYENTDRLPILPTCDCNNPKMTGVNYIGKVCPDCGTFVTPVTEKPILSNLWIRAPEGVRALINPVFWAIMSKEFTVSKVSLLDWLTVPSYKPPTDNIYAIDVLKAAGVVRGLNYFIDNFDKIMELLLDGKTITNIKAVDRAGLMHYIKENREVIFPKYLPIPNKIAFIMEQSHSVTYGDSGMGSAIDAVRAISSIYIPSLPVSQQVKENRTVKAIKQLADYYALQFKDTIGQKTGWARKHGVGSRQDWSARCVISSITDPHHYEDVYLPWGLSVALFHAHIANYLLKDNLTVNEIEERIHYATFHYDERIHEILNDIIATAPGRGPSVIIQRN